ncbi:hypothetical protein M3Y96_00691700 [Aphelenchoides besseyi]|nr:hypothetical protein M3Y96_00691700 [Aphelenchoides besseyi]
MELIIDLQDHTGKSHRKVLLKFGDEATVEQLKDQIQSTFQIPVNKQEIFCGEERVDLFGSNSLLSQLNLKRVDALIVKHAQLPNWNAYLEEVERIRRITTSEATSRRKGIAIRAREQLSPLDDSDFFVAYSTFLSQREDIDAEINYLVHNSMKYLKRSVDAYFAQHFSGHEVKLVDKPKDLGGVQLGLFVFVKESSSGLTNKYYAKKTGNLPKVEFAPTSKQTIDLPELFVYHLLSLFGVGADEVHIVPDTTKSEYVYLATKLIDDFCTGSGKTLKTGRNVRAEARNDRGITKQLELLQGLLCLNDLFENSGNYGMVERQDDSAKGLVQEPKIVDFKANAKGTPKISKSRQDTSHFESYILKWKLLENVENGKQVVLDNDAIKDNANVDKKEFEKYTTGIKKVFATLTVSFSFSIAPYVCALARKSEAEQ